MAVCKHTIVKVDVHPVMNVERYKKHIDGFSPFMIGEKGAPVLKKENLLCFL